MLRLAVKRGKIEKPELCSNCQIKPKLSEQIEAHHKDYSKPFDVEWLCVPCHKKADVRDGTNGFIVYWKRIMDKKNKIGTKEFGKSGSDARWSVRYELLKTVSSQVSKKDLNWIQAKWKTKQIQMLVSACNKNEKA